MDRGDFFLFAWLFITGIVGGSGASQIHVHTRVVFCAGLLFVAEVEQDDA
jgi:hypothetical protein